MNNTFKTRHIWRMLWGLGFLMGLSLSGHAQLSNAIWYFGDRAGLDFNTTPPTSISSDLYAFEGTATICSPAGELLFYTNGAAIWNREHNLMPNGSGLAGGASSTQAALIVPLPGSCGIYYLFTTEDQFTDGGLAYSVVDMCLDHGRGDVRPGNKNIVLANRTSEKITAVLHSNNTDIWILSHKLGSNEFLSFLLTSAGINTTPVISSVGGYYNFQAYIGPIKANHSGTKLVSTASFHGVCDLFDFDKSTGQISNRINLNNIFSSAQFVYGVEFSPNDSLLYLSSFWVTSNLFQYNLNTGALLQLNTISGNYHFGSIQMGIDQKLYVARENRGSLDVIHQPNIAGGGCQYVIGGQPLLTGTRSQHGLPNFAPYSFLQESSPPVLLGPDTVLCQGNILELTVSPGPGCGTTLRWDDGSGALTRWISESGVYWVEVEQACVKIADSIHVIFIPSIPTTLEIEICKGEIYEGYQTSGIYLDTFPTLSGCDSVRRLELTVTNDHQYERHIEICLGDSYMGISLPGVYLDTVIMLIGCDSIIHLHIEVIPLERHVFASICEGQSFEQYTQTGVYLDTLTGITGPCDTVRILHLTSHSPDYTFMEALACHGEAYLGYTSPGIYTDTLISVQGCDSIRTLNLSFLNPIESHFEGSVCEGRRFGYHAAGIYTDTLTSVAGCDSVQTIFLHDTHLYIPNVFSPNDDGINDLFFIFSNNDSRFDFNYFDVFDRWGNLLYHTEDWPVTWNGINKDGQLCPPGVYTYVMAYPCGADRLVRHGDITLIR